MALWFQFFKANRNFALVAEKVINFVMLVGVGPMQVFRLVPTYG